MASLNNISHGELFFVDGTSTDLVDAETHRINRNIRPFKSDRSFILLQRTFECAFEGQSFEDLHQQAFSNVPPMPYTIVYIHDGNNSTFMDGGGGIKWLSQHFTNPNSHAQVQKVYLFIQRYFDAHFTSLAWGNNLSGEIRELKDIFSLEMTEEHNKLREKYLRNILRPNTYNPDVVYLSQMLLYQNPKNDLALLALTDMCRLGLRDKELHVARLRKILEKELEADKKNVNILTCLGELYRIGGLDAVSDGPRAYKLLDEASHLDAKNWRALSSLGELFRTGAKDFPADLKKAALLLRTAHDMQPNDVAVLVSMGSICLAGGDDLLPVDKVIQSLEEALSHDKQNVDLLSLLGEIYRRGIGVFPPNIKRAHALLEYAHRLSPKNVKVLLSLGKLYRTGGEGLYPNVKRGRSLFESAHRLNPNNVETLACLAELHRTGGQGVEPNSQLAMQYLEQAQKIDSNNATVLAMLGEFYLVGSQQFCPDIRRAEKLLQQALHIDPKNLYALTTLAQLYWVGGKDIEPDARKALEYLETARKIAPNNVNVLSCLGALYFTGGLNLLDNETPARKFLEQAIQLNPYDVLSLVALQYFYRVQEVSREQALTLLKRAINVNPYNVVAIGSLLAALRGERATLYALPYEYKEVENLLDYKLAMKFHPYSIGIGVCFGILTNVKTSFVKKGYVSGQKFTFDNISGTLSEDDVFEQKNIKKVQAKLEEAVAFNPYCPYALFTLYDFYKIHSIQIPEKLIQAIQKTISLYKNDFYTLTDIGTEFYLRHSVFGADRLSDEEFQIALSCFERACSLPLNDDMKPHAYSKVHFMLALFYLQRDVEKGDFAHDFKPIKEHLELGLKYCPGVTSNPFIGEIVRTDLLQNYTIRIIFRYLKEISQKNPKNAFAHIAVGLLSFIGDSNQEKAVVLVQEGIRHFQEAWRLEPNNGFVLTQFGFVNLLVAAGFGIQGEGVSVLHSLSMAKGFLKKALEVDSQNPFAHFLYALVLLKLKGLGKSTIKIKEIRESLEKAYNLAPDQNHVMLMFRFAWVLKMEDKNSKLADELLTKAYVINPGYIKRRAKECNVALPQSIVQQVSHQQLTDEKKEVQENNDSELATSLSLLEDDLAHLSIDDEKKEN